MLSIKQTIKTLGLFILPASNECTLMELRGFKFLNVFNFVENSNDLPLRYNNKVPHNEITYRITKQQKM